MPAPPPHTAIATSKRLAAAGFLGAAAGGSGDVPLGASAAGSAAGSAPMATPEAPGVAQLPSAGAMQVDALEPGDVCDVSSAMDDVDTLRAVREVEGAMA